MPCDFISPVTFHDFFTCYAASLFNLDYFFVGLIMLGFFGFIAYKVRLPATLALSFGLGLVYMVDMISGGTTYGLQMLMLLLVFGIGVSIIKGVLDYGKEYSP